MADSIGPKNVLAFCSFMAGVLIFIWLSAKTAAATVVFAIFYGFFSGAVSLLFALDQIMTLIIGGDLVRQLFSCRRGEPDPRHFQVRRKIWQ